MFKRIAPQRAQHDDGSIVQVGSRYTVEYIKTGLVAEIKVDFGPITGIYPETLSLSIDGGETALPATEKGAVLDRIEQGLECLGIRYEIRNGGV